MNTTNNSLRSYASINAKRYRAAMRSAALEARSAIHPRSFHGVPIQFGDNTRFAVAYLEQAISLRQWAHDWEHRAKTGQFLY